MSVQVTTSETVEKEQEQEQQEELYDPMLDRLGALRGRNAAFVRGLLSELFDYSRSQANRARVLDRLQPTDDCEYGALLILQDETRVFVGEDPTAKTHSNFGFVIRPSDPIPAPSTAEEALDLLKPVGVKQSIEAEGAVPTRQGEWWLLETDETPTGPVYKPGVSKRPFGPSPLENHVPREYGLGITDGEFMANLEPRFPELYEKVESVPGTFERVWRAWEIADIDGVELVTDVPTMDELRSIAGDVFVRGTIRHRENDHFLEKIGETWHKARTHSMDVYTIDGVGTIPAVPEVRYD